MAFACPNLAGLASMEGAGVSAGVAYTIATGRLYCPVRDFHAEAERLLARPVLLHEFASPEVWDALRAALESELYNAVPEAERRPALHPTEGKACEPS